MPEGADGGSEKGRKFNLLLFTLAYIPPTQKHIQTHTRSHTHTHWQEFKGHPHFGWPAGNWRSQKPQHPTHMLIEFSQTSPPLSWQPYPRTGTPPKKTLPFALNFSFYFGISFDSLAHTYIYVGTYGGIYAICTHTHI